MQPLLAYKGDFKLLGNAEKFYMLLWKLEGYEAYIKYLCAVLYTYCFSFKSRVESMRLRHEFVIGYDFIKPSLTKMVDVAHGIYRV